MTNAQRKQHAWLVAVSCVAWILSLIVLPSLALNDAFGRSRGRPDGGETMVMLAQYWDLVLATAAVLVVAVLSAAGAVAISRSSGKTRSWDAEPR
jgi:hypothetical protein